MQGLFHIDREFEFYQAFNKYFTDKNNEPYWALFNTRKHRLAPDAISSRILNHWQKEGILPENCQSEGQKWREYTVMDLVWLTVVKELRDFGIGLPQIKKAKTRLKSAYNQCEYGEFEFYCALCLIAKRPCELLIYKDGSAEVATIYEINNTKENRGMLTNISISLNGVLQSIFPNENLQPKYDYWLDLDEDEISVINKIKSGDYTQLSITLEDGKVSKLKGDTKGNKKLYEIQNEGGDQDVLVKIRDGKITYTKQTKIDKL